MKLTNKTYDRIKFLVQIVAPALIVLIAGVGDLYGFDTQNIIGLITLLVTFTGSVLGISNLQYKKGE
jgi:hypothetical protein